MIGSMLFVAALLSALPTAFDYENGNYMLRGTLRNMTVCTTDPPAPNHGFTAYFDGHPCGDWEDGRPKIDFFVAYNIPYEATSTLDLARHVCGARMIVRSDLRIDGLKFVSCRQPDDHGLAIVRYVALRPPFPDEAKDPYGGTELLFTIYAKHNELPLYRSRMYRLAEELHLILGSRE